MPALFDALSVREITLPNRIVVSPMCQYSSEDGFANDWHLVHLGSRAVGGAGMVMMEATAIEPQGRITPQDMGIWKDEHIEPLQRITRFVEANGAIPAIQIAHAGRKASKSVPWEGDLPLSETDNGWRPIVAPSAVAFSEEDIIPKALELTEIAQLVQKFQDAACRALLAGFKVLEIHAAHGYLIHEFLSPLSNFRSDNYGGSFENRTRFLREIVQAVRQVWPEKYPLSVRISATDWVQDGWDIHQSATLAKELKSHGVDLIDCSSGGVIPGVKIQIGPGYQVPLSEAIKRNADILTGAVGLITEPGQANDIIKEGKADLVFLARQLLRDPYWPLHAAQVLGIEMPWPKQYTRAKPRIPELRKT